MHAYAFDLRFEEREGHLLRALFALAGAQAYRVHTAIDRHTKTEPVVSYQIGDGVRVHGDGEAETSVREGQDVALSDQGLRPKALAQTAKVPLSRASGRRAIPR